MFQTHPNSFVSCSATSPTQTPNKPVWWEIQKEGNNPMRYETVSAPTAIASIAMPSEEQNKIDYLNRRAQNVHRNIEQKFRDMFHLYGPSQPRYYKELIDAIKNGDYEIDEKAAKAADEAWEDFQNNREDWFDYSVFYGINFPKFPKPDWKGRDVALKELSAEFQRVKDIIAIMPAEEALKAVQEFEKWTPSNAPAKQ